jgi:hypothetical protein
MPFNYRYHIIFISLHFVTNLYTIWHQILFFDAKKGVKLPIKQFHLSKAFEHFIIATQISTRPLKLK